MPINQYGQMVSDDQNRLGVSGTGIIDAGNAAAQQGGTQQNAFGTVTPGQISSAGAAPVAPPVQNFNFNAKYAAQNQGLEQLLADKQMEQQNQLFAASQDYERQRTDAGTTRQKALDALIAKFATSGMFGSTADAEARGELETNYNKYLGDLSIALGNAKQGIYGNYANTIRGVNSERSRMWGLQRGEEEAEAKANEQRRLDAEKQQRDADNARYIAEQYAAAAARPAPVINLGNQGWPSASGVTGGGGAGGAGGGGGGGGGAYGLSAQGWGISGGDTYQDIMNQLPLLDMHQVSTLYSHPQFNTGWGADLKKAIGQYISNASTPGSPGYRPSTYSNPGGFY